MEIIQLACGIVVLVCGVILGGTWIWECIKLNPDDLWPDDDE